MSDECCAVPGAGPDAGGSACPVCGQTGKSVGLQTLKALLRPEALRRLQPAEGFRFCASPGCPIVYYSIGQSYAVGDVAKTVFQKSGHPGDEVCYCFGYARGPLADAAARKLAMAEVVKLVKNGACACEIRNPQGSCCLGNIASLGREAVR